MDTEKILASADEAGARTPWHQGWDLTDDRRRFFSDRSRRSAAAKALAVAGEAASQHVINEPRLEPESLMPVASPTELSSLSLFSGGGGLDLGFDLAGFDHAISFDTLEAAGRTLLTNRPGWSVRSGADGDVRGVAWRDVCTGIDVIHGGPPCQPFSAAGRQRGDADERNMLPEFVRAVRELAPRAFVAENVPALAGPKFADHLDTAFYRPLGRHYAISLIKLSAHDFGVPQVRNRVFLVGFRHRVDAARFNAPPVTHRADHLRSGQAGLADDALPPTMGARQALGLSDIGRDALAPTLRSTLTGPRHTTSILSSASAQKVWRGIGIWPNGVAPTREAASAFPAENGHFRLSVADCAVLQGFPADWKFHGPTYMSLGQIGNSVAPPVAYRVAQAVAAAIRG